MRYVTAEDVLRLLDELGPLWPDEIAEVRDAELEAVQAVLIEMLAAGVVRYTDHGYAPEGGFRIERELLAANAARLTRQLDVMRRALSTRPLGGSRRRHLQQDAS